jgi:hypothetical protein
MVDYDFVTTCPTLEYIKDKKKIEILGEVRVVEYTPKMKLTFFLSGSTLETFFSSFMPILLATVMTVVNYFRVPDEADYLANSIAVSLTVIFVLPQIANKDSFNSGMTSNDCYIILLFVSMILGTLPHGVFRLMSMGLMSSSLLIPLSNFHRYLVVKRGIKSNNPLNGPFCGRPGSVVDENGEEIRRSDNKSSRSADIGLLSLASATQREGIGRESVLRSIGTPTTGSRKRLDG